MNDHAPNSEQSLIIMLKKSSSLSATNKDKKIEQMEKDFSKSIKPNSNIYWLINYEEPPFPVIEIAKHIDSLIQNIKVWDAATILHYQNQKHRMFCNSMKDKNSELVMEKQEGAPIKSNRMNRSSNAALTNLMPCSSIYKFDKDHLCFMIESFNSLINILDIVISVGFLTFKSLHAIEQYVLQLTIFLI